MSNLREVRIRDFVRKQDEIVIPNIAGMKGRVRITGFDISRKSSKLLHDDSNLIVYVGREWVQEKIFNVDNGSTPTNNTHGIYWASFGSGGAPASDPLNPTPPTNVDTGLASEIVINSSNANYADAGKKYPVWGNTEFQQDGANDNRYLITKITLTLDENDANGENINEAALWISESYDPSTASQFYLFARATFPTIAKTSSLVLQIEWYIFS